MDEITIFLISGIRCDTGHHWLNEVFFFNMTKVFISFLFQMRACNLCVTLSKECHFIGLLQTNIVFSYLQHVQLVRTFLDPSETSKKPTFFKSFLPKFNYLFAKISLQSNGVMLENRQNKTNINIRDTFNCVMKWIL